MISSKSATILAATVGSLLLTSTISSYLRRKEISEGDENINEDDCIKASEVIQIFDALFIQMQSVLAQLSQQIQQIQMAGQSIPEKQLRQLLVAEFERALLVKEQSLLQEHKIDEDCLREATWQMMALPKEYPKVVASVERFQKLYENISGKSIVGRRPGDGKISGANSDAVVTSSLTKEELLEAASIYFDALTNSMGDHVRRFKDEGKNLQDPVVAHELQLLFSTANEAAENALKTKAGCNLESFKAAIEKYSQNPEVARALAMLQMKQQQVLMALGVTPM